MAHPDLESARLKRDRAHEHIEGLKTEQERWAKAHPEPFTWSLKDDVQPDRIIGVINTVERPPGYMSTMFGDCIHNLHSSLDHTAWQLFKHGTTPTLKPSQEHQIQFPIYNTLDEFNDNLIRRLSMGLRDVHEAIVRRYQPYQRGALAADHPFAILNRLSRTDKHRNINLTWWCASKATFEVTSRPIGCLIKDMNVLLDLFDPLDVDTPLFDVVVAGDRTLCRGMEVKTHLTYQISLEKGEWVHDTVSHIKTMVSDLLAEIDGVL